MLSDSSHITCQDCRHMTKNIYINNLKTSPISNSANLLKGNAAFLKKYIYIYIMDENDSLSEHNKIPLWSQSYQWRRLLQNLLQS